MNLTHELIGPVSVIRFPERLTMADAPAIRRELQELVAAGHAQLVMEMSDVEFVDSSGLSVLVSASKLARNAGGNAVLVGISGQVEALVELTRLHRIIEVFLDRQSAVSYLEPTATAH